jgi:hypothetical protein
VGAFFSGVILLLFLVVMTQSMGRRKRLKQREALKNWVFAPVYAHEVLRQYPHLSGSEVDMAFELLRLYFEVCWEYQLKTVAMPSKLIDACWHVFMLDSRRYQQFCMDVYGSYLHHEPLRPVAQTQQGAAADGCTTIEKANQNKVQSTVDDPHLLAMVQAFHGSLALTEKASPLKPAVLDHQWEKAKSVPSLFTIDKEMAIAGGNFYSTEFLACLAQFDLKSKAGTMAGLDFVTGTAAADGSHASSSASDCGGSD